MPECNPVLVEVTRGDMVESRHRGAAAVVDAAGRVVAAWGDIERPVYGRSAIKPIQALPLLETGAADRYGLTDAEIALACASHSGEERHVRLVGAWLDRLGLDATCLECGTHLPYSQEATHALVRRGEAPSTLHNNCSGKHAGFVCTACHLGEAVKGYIDAGHPVQKRIERALAEMSGVDLSRAPRGIDGCGIPVIGLPLAGMARAMARLADPEGLPAERKEAARRIVRAWAAEPFLVAGTGRFCTALMEAAGSAVIVKAGAEGVYCAALPERGLGIALKIDDGSAAERAPAAALLGVLDRLGALTEEHKARLASWLPQTVRNRVGRAVGEIRAVVP